NATYGLESDAATGNRGDTINFGYTASGAAAGNSTADIFFSNSSASSLALQNSQVNSSPGIDTSGFNRAGNYLLSYNQDYATGTARIYGDYSVSGSTLTLDYANQLYTSTATTPKVMIKASGTNPTATVVSTTDTYAVSQ